MNKTEYLKWLREWNACKEGLKWVESRPEDFAKDILLACDRIDWLVWNIGRKNPTKIVEFAGRCSSRVDASRTAARRAWAEAEAEAEAAERAAAWAAAWAAERAAAWAAAWAAERAAAWAAAWAAERAAERAAAWAADAAARAAEEERRDQLADLHQLVEEVF